MKEVLESIVKECVERGIVVMTDIHNGEISYKVMGFSKSGEALLYVDGDEIICETRYGQKDHILTFDDLALVAKCWYEMYRDREPFKDVEPEWREVLGYYYDYKTKKENGLELNDLGDLPF